MLFSEKIAYIAEQIKEAPSTRFIIGAGASYSADVPLSDQMIRLIADKYPACFARLPEDDRTDYGKVMRTLDRAQRKRFLIPLLESAKINWGQIALASLFKHDHVSTVLTFNFDLILEKASGLLGMQIPVYDFGFAPTERVDELAIPSIVHLHGQSFGLILLNTEKETQKHQAALKPILKDTVQNHLTIVFGYSGENDSALETITDQYDSSRRLLWLGHSEDMPQHLQGLMDQEDAEYFGGMDFDATMIELAMALDAWPPELVTNPMTHLLDQLEPVTDYPVFDNATHYDILSPMRVRLDELSREWDKAPNYDDEVFSYQLGKPVSDERLAFFESNIGDLSDTAKLGLYWVYIGRGNSDHYNGAFKQAIISYEKALMFSPKGYEALNNWGAALGKLNRHNEAAQKFAAAVEIKPDYYDALYNWGNALLEFKRYEDASEIFQRAQDINGKASYNYACLMSLQKKPEAAIAELLACQVDGTLPDKAHLETDTDMDALRDHAEFKALLGGL